MYNMGLLTLSVQKVQNSPVGPISVFIGGTIVAYCAVVIYNALHRNEYIKCSQCNKINRIIMNKCVKCGGKISGFERVAFYLDKKTNKKTYSKK
jgi:hypothetical protein